MELYLLPRRISNYQDPRPLEIRGLTPKETPRKDEIMKPPMDSYVGKTSTSGNKKSLKAQAQEILMKIFLFGMSAGKWVILSLLRSVVQMSKSAISPNYYIRFSWIVRSRDREYRIFSFPLEISDIYILINSIFHNMIY
jgi:hypothetical protein